MAVRKFKSNKNNSLNSKPQGKSTIQINRKEKGLVLLDQTVIRKQTLGECHKTLKKIDKANVCFPEGFFNYLIFEISSRKFRRTYHTNQDAFSRDSRKKSFD